MTGGRLLKQDKQEHIDLFELNGNNRLPYFRITQDLGQTLLDLYYGNFEAAYRTIGDITDALGSVTGQAADEAIWQKIHTQAQDLIKAHYFFGALLQLLFTLYSGHMDKAFNWDVDRMRRQGIATEFQEVLYHDTLLDLYNYIKANCLRADIHIRPCKHCGRYFLVIDNSKLEYCDRRIEGSTKTCRQMGSVRNYTNRQMESPIVRAYTKAYKTHNARVRYGIMTKEEFQSWSKTARWRRDECIAGEMSLEDFQAWLDQDKT